MTTIPSTDIASTPSEIARPRLDRPMGIRTILIFFAIMALGLYFTAYSLHKDLTAASTPVTSYLPFLLLGVALLIELGFEFVNGFHDTANAVATVIYTHSLAPPVAVVWSGCFNFLGVLFSTGAVAFGIVAAAGRTDHAGWLRGRVRHGLRDVDRRDHLESRHMVAGVPASSSHTLIGSIIGVGVAKRLWAGVTEHRGSIGTRPLRSVMR
jgi:PiT family inorganic phosphate transporter